MRYAPIPKELRPSSATVRPLGGDGTYDEAAVISAVGFQGATTLAANGRQLASGLSGMLYVDATSPGAFEIPTGSKVAVDGGPDWMVVEGVETVRTLDGVHHWEVTLR